MSARAPIPAVSSSMNDDGDRFVSTSKIDADDVVEAFCKKSIENGIDVVRVFDALNDFFLGAVMCGENIIHFFYA